MNESTNERGPDCGERVMARPCEQDIHTSLGVITPRDINAFASNVSGLCKLIGDLKTKKEIKQVAKAVRDNWNRYRDSA